MGIRTELGHLRRSIRTPGSTSNGTAWAALGLASSAIASLAASAVLVAGSSVDVFADIAVLVVSVLILSTLLRFGTDRLFLGEVHSVEASEGRRAAVARSTGLVGFSIVMGILGAIVCATGLFAIPVNPALSSPLSVAESVLLGVWMGAEITRFVVSETHRWLHRFNWAAFSGMGARMPLYLVLLAVLMAVDPVGRREAIAANAVASFVICCVAMAPLVRMLPWRRVNPLDSIRRTWRGHGWMVVTSFGAAVIGGADVYVVGLSIGPDATATYAFAVTLCAGITAIGTAVVFGVGPRLAASIQNGRMDSAQNLAVGASRFSSGVALVAFSGLLVVAAPLAVRLGGDEYSGIAGFVAILGGGQVLAIVAGVGGTALILARRYMVISALTVATAVAMVLGTFAVGQALGSALAIAVVSSSATLALKVGAAFAAKHYLGIRTDALSKRPAMAA